MSYGLMMGGQDAVRCLEMYQDNFPEEIKTEEFCDEYERVLNRIRYEVDRSVPIAPKVLEAKVRSFGKFYSCGECGFSVREDFYKYCPKCGRAINWRAVL